MNVAQIILALVQASRLALEAVERYQRGDMTDEELRAAWTAMQTRLDDVSARIQA